MFEIISNNGNYADFILVRRQINCNDMTSDDFVSAISEDFKAALDSYVENAFPKMRDYAIKRNRENVEQKRERTITRAIEYAKKKWKTEKRRNRYVQDIIMQLDSEITNYEPQLSNINFFDIDGNCGTQMGINALCVLNGKDIYNNEKLTACYNVLLNTKYFRKAIGWQFIYNGDAKTYRSAFRPKIQLLFDTETVEEIKKSVASLDCAVFDFYKNTNYYGD